MKVDAELFDLCKDFIRENKIESPDDIYSMSDNVCDLMTEICDLIGYYDHDEETQDLFDEE
jgi:hypothetical protein